MRIKMFGLLVVFAVVISGLIFLGFEIAVRQNVTRVVPLNGKKSALFVESNPDRLIRNTSRGRRLRPNSEAMILNHYTSHKDIPMRINSLGFRGPEVQVPKPASTFRILFLGDSITWGDYLLEEDTFVTRAAKYLQDKVADKKIETINAGVGNIGTQEELEILQESGLKVDPNLVVLCFYLNDSRPPFGFPGEIGHRGWWRRHSSLIDMIYKNIVLKFLEKKPEYDGQWVFMRDKLPWKTDNAAFLELANWARFDWGAAWKPDSWLTTDRQFKELQKIAQRHHVRILVVACPVMFQVYADHPNIEPQNKLAQLSHSLGFDYLDLLPMYRGLHKANLFYDQCHPIPEANDKIAQTLAAYLAPQVR